MVVLLDTNIIMDALQERSPFDAPAKEILKLGQSDKLTCMFTANADADIFYLYSKSRDTQAATAVLDFLFKTYTIISVTHEDCVSALSLPIVDSEDALVTVCVQKAKADYIITRDKRFLTEHSPVKAIFPNDFLSTYLKEA